jgi:hypothetical protein
MAFLSNRPFALAKNELLALDDIQWHTPISNLWEIDKQNPAIYCKALWTFW